MHTFWIAIWLSWQDIVIWIQFFDAYLLSINWITSSMVDALRNIQAHKLKGDLEDMSPTQLKNSFNLAIKITTFCVCHHSCPNPPSKFLLRRSLGSARDWSCYCHDIGCWTCQVLTVSSCVYNLKLVPKAIAQIM